MRTVLGVLIGLGVGTALWASTGQMGVAVGVGAGVGFLCIVASVAVQRILSLDPPQ